MPYAVDAAVDTAVDAAVDTSAGAVISQLYTLE